MDKIALLEKDIRSLKIQGATNIALTVIKAIVQKSEIPDQQENNYEQILSCARRLAYVRPNEPLSQNIIKYVFDRKEQTASYYKRRALDYQMLMQQAIQKIINLGLNLIRNGAVYLTHCHSSTVINVFYEARKSGKQFSVLIAETRPLYQGRITATELLEKGIEDVTFMIDDCAISAIEGRLKNIDAIIIGADVLTGKGFVNKVGTMALVRACERAEIPVFTFTSLLKYFSHPFGNNDIEVRSGQEIWKEAPKDLKFYAPAFDFVPYTSNLKIVCEAGIIAGNEVADKAGRLYNFLRR
ncbi:hypothetical protein A2Y99_00035 [Candidatus Gottesmanbacteria bacterium RBG_13_37_7]|uniref:Uncharacterized protein n=1 Tax=Candidatus Gottesmanbacteria bacterium RBG_13_37_7 TaxID=1798369 RepID=A0A1F5YGL4_9BACT|nr:MAG: hypothetical protein A2Y99_00035 [Candidatus Gottesmanbacteria bacterium RBG_13_37_7]